MEGDLYGFMIDLASGRIMKSSPTNCDNLLLQWYPPKFNSPGFSSSGDITDSKFFIVLPLPPSLPSTLHRSAVAPSSPVRPVAPWGHYRGTAPASLRRARRSTGHAGRGGSRGGAPTARHRPPACESAPHPQGSPAGQRWNRRLSH